MISKYLGIKHEYGIFDCIILVQQFYKNELGVSLDLPPYPHSASWMKHFTTTSFDERASKYGTKVLLTGAKNYDLIVFKSDKSEHLIHFGIYLMPNKMLHIEDGRTSRIDTLSDYWLNHLYAIYRHDNLVQ
jgi:cell wall-associated NlpC family hydrolase